MPARELSFSYYREEGGICETEGSYIVGERGYGGKSGNAICFACSSLPQNIGTACSSLSQYTLYTLYTIQALLWIVFKSVDCDGGGVRRPNLVNKLQGVPKKMQHSVL